MKILQVPFTFAPDPIGGTEVYVESLARGLRTHGVEVAIAAPGKMTTVYEYHGLSVQRYAVAPALTLYDIYGEGDRIAADGFTHILENERPALVHFHAFTGAVSLRIVREVKHLGVPAVFTYHTPTVSCVRGTLMQWGHTICDGRLRLDLCTRCTLHGLGLPRLLTEVVGRVPTSVGRAVGTWGVRGKGWTALRMRELIGVRHAVVRHLLHEVDHVVAVCQWVQDLLIHNGVPPSKITLSRQGLATTAGVERQTSAARKPSMPIRLAFFGRLDPVKGVHVLIQALRTNLSLPIALDIYGIVQGEGESRYRQSLVRLISGDPRVTFKDPVTPPETVSRLQEYDFLVVPSQWFETGPLVILEAFAAGVPVLGSRLGGIAELVTHDVDGLLVDPDSPSMWRTTLQRVCDDPGLANRLRQGIRPVRTMDDVARDMVSLYRRFVREGS